LTLFTPYLHHYLHLHSFPTRRSSDLANLETSTFVRRWSPSDISVLGSSRLRSFRLRSLRLVRETGQILHARGDSQNGRDGGATLDRKSTRLNSSHQIISYAVFCLKKK